MTVDDDPNLVMFFKEFFKQEGYNSLCLEDAERAVRIANLVHPDLLIIDVRMPKIDGFGVLAKVREHTPEIKTIIISAYVDSFQDKIKEAKVQAVLKKPVQFEELEKWILKLLAATKEEIQEKILPGERPTIRVLFVEDETEIAHPVAEAFNEYGFLTDTALSGEEGLEKARNKNYDILITDNSMRSMSGLEMVGKILSEARVKPHVIAIFSANLTNPLKEKYAALGVSHFLPKPATLQQLIDWLESQIPVIVKKKKAG